MGPAPVVQQPEHGKARRTAEVIGAIGFCRCLKKSRCSVLYLVRLLYLLNFVALDRRAAQTRCPCMRRCSPSYVYRRFARVQSAIVVG
jgi:hypothetical protein